MPILTDKRDTNTRKIVLPSYVGLKEDQQGYVVVYEKPNAGDLMTPEAATPKGATLASIVGMVKEWNFTDKDGNALPITPETLQILEPEDLAFLIKLVEEYGKKALDVKKNLQTGKKNTKKK